MGERRTVLAVAVVVGVLLLIAAAVVHFGMRAGSATSSGAGASGGYAATMRSAVRREDGSWHITIHLSSAREWDELTVSGTEVQAKGARVPEWQAQLETPIPKGRVPAELDLDFSTPPIPRPAEELFLNIEIRSSYSRPLASGSSHSSRMLEFVTGGGK